MNEWRATAERQYGVVTRDQLRDEHLTDRQIQTLTATGSLQRLHPAVFRVSGS